MVLYMWKNKASKFEGLVVGSIKCQQRIKENVPVILWPSLWHFVFVVWNQQKYFLVSGFEIFFCAYYSSDALASNNFFG